MSSPSPLSPAEEWAILCARVNDLAVQAFRKALTVYERAGKFRTGEAVALVEQLTAAEKVTSDIYEFLQRQLAGRRVKPEANGSHKPQEARS